MRRCALVALVMAGGAARAQGADPWFGPDKAIHFGVSAGLASGSYALAGLWPASSEPLRLVVGGAASLAAGAAKELLDLTFGLGTPSWRDFTWDVAGAAVGLAVAWAVDRFVVQPLALQLRWVRVAGHAL